MNSLTIQINKYIGDFFLEYEEYPIYLAMNKEKEEIYSSSEWKEFKEMIYRTNIEVLFYDEEFISENELYIESDNYFTSYELY